MPHLLVHVEQYDVLGILPSQLESLALVADAMGVQRRAFVDGTADGVRRSHGFERYGSLEEWMGEVDSGIVAFDPGSHSSLDEISVGQEDWLAFGPAMGFAEAFGIPVRWARIPGGTLSSRDAVPIVLWEVSSWPAR